MNALPTTNYLVGGVNLKSISKKDELVKYARREIVKLSEKIDAYSNLINNNGGTI